MELTSGFTLKDRYVIKEQLGQGGMGAVYLAEDTALDQLVAVKANLNRSQQSQRQFEVEARLLAKLRHPNLPLVFDHFIIDDVQYLVMDYIPGEDLSHKLKEDGPQAVFQVLEWAEQINSALTYLHSQNPPVIHRDIKPANLKIQPDGKIVLVDFGIAKASEGDTTMGARGYSPGYAPPEQYSDAMTGPYSDQYSFAATLYAMLTGNPPPESIDMMLGQKTLTPSRTYSPKIPLHVDAAIQRAMAIEPDKRYASIRQFLTALTDPAALADDTLKPEPAQTAADAAADTFIQTVPQQPTVEAPQTATQISDEVLPSRTPNRTVLYIMGGLVVVAGLVGAFLLFGGSRDNPPVDVAGVPSSTAPAAAILPTETSQPTETEIPATPEPSATTAPTLSPTLPPTTEPTNTLPPAPQPTPLGFGGKIAFVSDRAGPYDQIFVMESDGSNITQLTFDETDKSWPMWSPDGQKILYVADGGFGLYNTPLNLDIWVMDADGSNQTNLSQTREDDEDPVWSPDGSQIVFVSRRYGGTRQLMVMNADGSDQRRVSNEFEEYNATFSPDGNTLMFSSTFFYTLNVRIWDENNHPPEAQDIYDLEPQLYDNRWNESDRIGKGLEPAWSPNGDWIVFVRTSGNNRRIYLLDANSDGATVRSLETLGLNYDPGWSPDSLWIVFCSTRDGNQEIYIMDFGGRFQTNLTNHAGVDKMPSWQPLP